MKTTDHFLSLYKEYETLLREKGLDTKSYEETNACASDRLRMCRTFRNYLSHQNDAGFLNVSDKQIRFMEDIIRTLKNEGDIVKKHVKSPAQSTCSINDRCADALEKMIKLKINKIVVVKKDGYGTADIYSLTKAVLASKTTKISEIKLMNDYVFTEPSYLCDKLPAKGIFICVDSLKGNKLLGVYYK